MPLRATSPEQLHAAVNGRLVGLPFISLVLTVHFSVELLLADPTSLDPKEPQLDQQLESFSTAFSTLARMHNLSLPGNFIECSIKAMKCLKESGRMNVLYSLAKGLATTRNDGSGPKFPTTRMLMGLLEYMV